MSEPTLRTDNRIHIGADEALPTVDEDGGALPVGRELLRDNGGTYYWTGSNFTAVTADQKLCQIAEFLREIRDLLSSQG
jgi:hypothetical protein